jgi:hypothetical protein
VKFPLADIDTKVTAGFGAGVGVGLGVGLTAATGLPFAPF